MTLSEPPEALAYRRAILDAYRSTVGTTGRVRVTDRHLASELHSRGVPLQTVLDALLLATARRYGRATPGHPPPTIRSLAYVLPVIDEIRDASLPDGYRRYLVLKISRSLAVLGIPAP